MIHNICRGFFLKGHNIKHPDKEYNFCTQLKKKNIFYAFKDFYLHFLCVLKYRGHSSNLQVASLLQYSNNQYNILRYHHKNIN